MHILWCVCVRVQLSSASRDKILEKCQLVHHSKPQKSDGGFFSQNFRYRDEKLDKFPLFDFLVPEYLFRIAKFPSR